MATFRKYGGTNYSPIANIVRHNMFNSKSCSFTTSGLYNSKETFLSHIDMSGSSILHVGNLYFQDGTSISSGTIVNPPLATILSYGNSAGTYNINMNKNAILDLSYIFFSDGTTLNTATGINPTLASVLATNNSAGSNNIDMNGQNINNINSVEINGITQNKTYTGFNTPGTYKSATLTFNTSGQITNVIDNSLSPYGLTQVLTTSEDGGGKTISNVNNISFTGMLTQTSSHTNSLNSTAFNGVCRYPSAIIPLNDYDIPSTGYVNSIASGLSPTTLCNCATTQDISFSGINVPTTIDGVTLVNEYRVLVKCQDSSNNVSSSKISNGIYIYQYDTCGSLIRSPDCSGNNVANQLTFISDGSLNGMKAFVQANTPAIAGTNPLNYVPFYSLNYNLGQGLELVNASTLQVKSNLDFLTNIKIKNDLPSFQITNTPETKKIFTALNLTPTTYNNITKSGDNGLFSGLDDLSSGSPLVLSTWSTGPNGIRITNNSVTLQSDSSNWYDLSLGGHNFYGNIVMNSNSSSSRQITTGYLNLSPISGSPTSVETQIYQNTNVVVFDNNADTTLNYGSSYLFACNNLNTNLSSSQTTPLSFNSSLLTIDLSNNALGSSIVKYQAYNNSNYGSTIGHNFYGNMYLKNGRFKRDVGYVVGSTTDISNNSMNIILNYVAITFTIQSGSGIFTLPEVDDTNIGLQVVITNVSSGINLQFYGYSGQKVYSAYDTINSSSTLVSNNQCKQFTTIKCSTGTSISSYGWSVLP